MNGSYELSLRVICGTKGISRVTYVNFSMVKSVR